MQYPIAIFQQNNHYYVTIPDIKSLDVQGNDMAEAVANARLAIINHLHHLTQDELPIPEPTPVSDHLVNPQYAGYIWAIVSVDLSRIIGEVIEVNLQLPAQLGEQISAQFPNDALDKIVIQALKQFLKSNQS